jgi:hypothetical protein
MRQVIIIGGAAKASCLDVELCDQEGVEIWAVNLQHTRDPWLPRTDRMFNIHKYELLKAYGYPLVRDAEWCRDNKDTKFYVADRWPDRRMARALIFPRHEIANQFPAARNEYHCNSCDWLLAYALYEGFEAAHLHGWTLARDGAVEQVSARACAEYWSGFCEGRGMKIVLAADSDLFHPYHLVRTDRVYGYDDCPAWVDESKDRRFDGAPYRYNDY